MRNLNMDDGDEKIKGKKTCLPIILMQPLRTEYSSHYFAFKSPIFIVGNYSPDELLNIEDIR